ncbi:Protein-lysine N-methyltransferase Mettl10 [Trichoplax sp. H2]|uniref:Protein-lysine N-methyltransferase TRIADDRAFT_23674 n=1 Tax=Trichoplax adhaerens TaxID=10228 RepID=B3RUN0_TRIAD|nr:hypothetical protein TRIADDRAFT_23674 [Trichoplax adhaerens]EDV25354.1 hypothetical protein TRIADDRAFT_23674 [Trichoplax adhaerens]RDD42920.1 Protein-lysine N-methyltransferase Mettl10 [Trichoplax sp. H2]|eukprot:XP_002111387.1 hypothetical protein TRIADDRAFT_23674 [Trichoplax adhaerens]
MADDDSDLKGSDAIDEIDIDPSVLGTKEYWDNNYKDEFSTFQEYGDVGEIWFGRDIMNRMLSWISTSDCIEKAAPILELGCGNGVLLLELLKKGFTNLTGIDYSNYGIDLAKAIAAKNDTKINFEVCNILNIEECESKVKWPYRAIIDKGTYDAICLNPEERLQCREKYKLNASHLLESNGLLIITSCNWTSNELKKHFSPEFLIEAEIPTPKFQFGGRAGNTVVSLIFKKTA